MRQFGTTNLTMSSAMKYLFGTLGAVAVIGILSAAPAYGDVVFTLGNNPQPNEENILFTGGQSGSTVTGTGQTTGLTVDFSSTTDTLTTPSNGQAKVEAADGLINDISIASPGNTFDDLIFNPENGSGTADVTVTATDGTFTFSYALANGNNFLTITTTMRETITQVTIDDTAGFPDLKQPRISGLAATSTVPEPPTFLMWIVPFLALLIFGGRKMLFA